MAEDDKNKTLMDEVYEFIKELYLEEEDKKIELKEKYIKNKFAINRFKREQVQYEKVNDTNIGFFNPNTNMLNEKIENIKQEIEKLSAEQAEGEEKIRIVEKRMDKISILKSLLAEKEEQERKEKEKKKKENKKRQEKEKREKEEQERLEKERRESEEQECFEKEERESEGHERFEKEGSESEEQERLEKEKCESEEQERFEKKGRESEEPEYLEKEEHKSEEQECFEKERSESEEQNHLEKEEHKSEEQECLEKEGHESEGRQHQEETGQEGGIQETLEKENRLKSEDRSASSILKTNEAERQRIARELHDTTVKNLTGLIHKTEYCLLLANNGSEVVKSELSAMKKVLENTIDEMHNIIYDLRTGDIEKLGLTKTVKQYIQRLEKQYEEITFDVSIESEEKKLDSDAVLAIFRIIQEACYNAIKHGNVSLIFISIDYKKDSVEVSVEDDGIGFNYKKVMSRKEDNQGLGLSIMKERAELVSGKLDIQSEEEKGTSIKLIVPIVS